MKTHHPSQGRLKAAIVLVLAIARAVVSDASAQPVITLQLKDRFLSARQYTTLNVNAGGTAPTFQWFFNATEIPGETNRTLSLTNGTPSESGDYFAIARDATGTATSLVARVKVFISAPHRFESSISISNGSAVVDMAGEVNTTLGSYYDLYPVEVSSNLVDWTPLTTLRRTNAELSSLNLLDPDAQHFGSRFYRVPTNHFATYLPTPAGPFAIGVTSRLLSDPSRTNRRPFMISVWYPGTARAGVWPSLFMDPRVASRFLTAIKDPGTAVVQMYQSFHSHALSDVPLAGETEYPIVIYSPGQDGPREWSAAQVENLVSHGFIVLSIDRNDATASVYPDGQIIKGVDTSASGGYPSMVQGRAQDKRFVIDELERWALSDSFCQGRLDVEHIGIFGFSLGGETVMKVVPDEPRCKALMCIDGSATSPLPSAPFKEPYLYAHLALPFRPDYMTFFSKFTHDAYAFDIKDAGHGDGDDSGMVWDTSQGSFAPPTESHRRAGRILRAYMLSFFTKYLKGQDDHVLDGPLADYPEIQNYTKK